MTGRVFTGTRGQAVELEPDPALPGADTTVAFWLLTGPWHPVWRQFALAVVHLRETPTGPRPMLAFPGATHELLVLALNPGEPPRVHLPEALEQGGLSAVGGYLSPVDVVHQFEATDDEMVRLAELCAQGCVGGLLTPSTDDARSVLREQWLSACVRTLAHMRGEEHAR